MSVDAALEDFARHNPQSLSVIDSLEESELLLDSLMAAGMDERDLLTRVCQSCYPRELFVFLAERFKDGPRWLKLVSAVLLTSEKNWAVNGGYLSEKMVCEELIPHVDALILFEKYGDVLRQTSHPLHERFSADRYWSEKTLSLIKLRDYTKAWEMIKQAKLGLIVKVEKPRKEPRSRCFKASSETLRKLVHRLFQEMRAEGLITEVVFNDMTVGATLRLSGSRRRIRTPALDFTLGLGGEEKSGQYHLGLHGAMAFKIAVYFYEHKKK